MRLLALAMRGFEPALRTDNYVTMWKESFGHMLDVAMGRPALEEVADGKAIREIEHTIYARIVDFGQLQKAASMEKHEQWEIKVPKTDLNAGRGGIRVRKTEIEGGEPVYVLTTKITANESGDKIELPIPTNEDNFHQIKFLSERGMIKHRYHFPIVGTELVWEVDMFPKQDGEGYHEWCKIDLEVQDRDAPIPELPLNFEEVIMPKGYGREDEEASEAKVTALYDQCFLARNPFLMARKADEAATQPEAEEKPAQGDSGSGNAT